jgi:hypothetical protein
MQSTWILRSCAMLRRGGFQVGITLKITVASPCETMNQVTKQHSVKPYMIVIFCYLLYAGM